MQCLGARPQGRELRCRNSLFWGTELECMSDTEMKNDGRQNQLPWQGQSAILAGWKVPVLLYSKYLSSV